MRGEGSFKRPCICHVAREPDGCGPARDDAHRVGKRRAVVAEACGVINSFLDRPRQNDFRGGGGLLDSPKELALRSSGGSRSTPPPRKSFWRGRSRKLLITPQASATTARRLPTL